MSEANSKLFSLDIITPSKKAFSGDVNYIKAPGVDGYLGVLPRHAPLLAALKIGEPTDVVILRGEEKLTLKITPQARE